MSFSHTNLKNVSYLFKSYGACADKTYWRTFIKTKLFIYFRRIVRSINWHQTRQLNLAPDAATIHTVPYKFWKHRPYFYLHKVKNSFVFYFPAADVSLLLCKTQTPKFQVYWKSALCVRRLWGQVGTTFQFSKRNIHLQSTPLE